VAAQGSALAARVAFDLVAVGVEGHDMAGVELDHALLCPFDGGIAVIGPVDGLLEGVGFDLGGVVDVGVDAGENGELGHGSLQLEDCAGTTGVSLPTADW